MSVGRLRAPLTSARRSAVPAGGHAQCHRDAALQEDYVARRKGHGLIARHTLTFHPSDLAVACAQAGDGLVRGHDMLQESHSFVPVVVMCAESVSASLATT